MTGQTATGTDVLDRDVRLYVFGKAAEEARVPDPAQISAALGRPQPEIEESLRRLAAGRVLILAPNTTNIWAANPFCAVPSGALTGASASGTLWASPPPCRPTRPSPPAVSTATTTWSSISRTMRWFAARESSTSACRLPGGGTT